MSKFESNYAVYDSSRYYVYLPLKRIAFYWFKFYYPIIKSNNFIAQLNGESNNEKSRQIGFRKLINQTYDQENLGEILGDYDDNKNRESLDKILKTIRDVIYNGPMKYVGEEAYDVFKYLPAKEAKYFLSLKEIEMGMIGVPTSIWHDIILFGHWIEDSILIEWAKLTEKMNNNEKFAEYFKLLTTPILDERNTTLVRQLLSNERVECVYSGETVNSYDVDHVIPFSKWGNNDLWNLLPAESSLNNQKRDKIPDTSLVLKRKDIIISYWDLYKKSYPDKFSYQVQKSLGDVDINNWENNVFLNFYETLSRIKTRKAIDVWSI